MENAIKEDIGFYNFIPYIQKHEFEALLFSSNEGFKTFFDETEYNETQKVIEQYSDPEEINDHLVPSKRIMAIVKNYNKVADGMDIASEVGIDKMMEKCQHFRNWINRLIEELLTV